MSSYFEVMNRKRSWTPVAVDKGELVEGSEDTLFRALALRNLELPVKEFLSQGLEKDLPKKPGVIEALMSNQLDEDKHDLGFQYVTQAHGIDESAEKEADVIRQAWLDAPEHPILKASILERSVFFVLLPFYRFNGDVGIRTLAADISRDEMTHVALHGMVAHDLGLRSTPNLNKLRKATVHWVMDQLGTHSNKWLNKDFWLSQSDSLYEKGKADGLGETKRQRAVAFFEASNVNLPQYG